MDLTHVLSLAILQGLTEFLPISSSAHLILLPAIAGWPDQGLAFDVAVHVGTLVAVLAYFRHVLAGLARDWVRSIALHRLTGDSHLAWGILLGSVPVVVGGWLLNAYGTDGLRSPLVIAVATLAFALLLWWADARGRRVRDEYSITWRDVILIGLAQTLALIPGTSRAGITITAGLALGITRAGAARFSFLLAIPVILLAGSLKALDASRSALPTDWSALLMGGVAAGVSAYLCIHFFLKLLERVGLMPFVIYRLALGIILLVYFA